MRPALVPAEVRAAPAVRCFVVAGPDGDLTSTDVAPIEVFLSSTTLAGRSVPCVGVALQLEAGDLEALEAGAPVLLLFPTHRLPPVFAVEVGLDRFDG